MASRLYVSRLPWTVCRDQLTKHFQRFGEVASASIAFDWETGLSRGYGFVQYKDDKASNAALRASHEIAGVKVDLKVSRHSAQTSDQQESSSKTAE